MIYFILAKGTNSVKIGIAEHVRSRMTNLQTASPFELEVLAVMGSKDHGITGLREIDIEQSLHRHFSPYHIRGEWFRLEGELAAFIDDFIKLKESMAAKNIELQYYYTQEYLQKLTSFVGAPERLKRYGITKVKS